jgi:hypothetical protein
MDLQAQTETARKEHLQQQLVVLSFVNLLVVAVLGVLLRAFPFFSSFPLTYKNILHGHSHFAFGGWVTPVLLALVMKSFPLLKAAIPFHHWRNISALMLLSAYGMLFTFPFQGYAAASISFSLLSVAATVYAALIVWKAIESLVQTTSLLFLKWGLLYGCLSATGPFATGPLAAMGKSGSALYFDAIYFYLHFQYNGFFTFVVLALLCCSIEGYSDQSKDKHVFQLFNFACVPAFALSVLWSGPSVLFNWIGGAAAVLQLAGLCLLLHQLRVVPLHHGKLTFCLAMAAFVLKNILQTTSALPAVAVMANQYRNFVIAYLHLVLLGFVTLFVFSRLVPKNGPGRWGVQLFLFSFITTEALIVLQASSGWLQMSIPYSAELLLCCSALFPVSILLLLISLVRLKLTSTKTQLLPKIHVVSRNPAE